MKPRKPAQEMERGDNMLKDAFLFLNKRYEKQTFFFCLLMAVIILWIDYITGKYIQFPVLYIFPIGMAAWRAQKRSAYGLAVVMSLARVAFHVPWHEAQSFPTMIYNALITMFALILYAYLIDRVAWQTKKLEMKVRNLEGILPICASCKRIRNEKGEYEPVEKYITEHSEALFSHSICRECAKKLYPELEVKK